MHWEVVGIRDLNHFKFFSYKTRQSELNKDRWLNILMIKLTFFLPTRKARKCSASRSASVYFRYLPPRWVEECSSCSGSFPGRIRWTEVILTVVFFQQGSECKKINWRRMKSHQMLDTCCVENRLLRPEEVVPICMSYESFDGTRAERTSQPNVMSHQSRMSVVNNIPFDTYFLC